MRGATRNIEDKFITRKIVVVFRTALFLLKLTIFQKINSLMVKKKQKTHTHTPEISITRFQVLRKTSNQKTLNFLVHLQIQKTVQQPIFIYNL